jgi:hypothetical protein
MAETARARDSARRETSASRLGHDGVWWAGEGATGVERHAFNNRAPHVARDAGDLGPHPAVPEDGPVRHDRATLNRDVTDVCVGARSAKLGGPLYAVEFEVAGVLCHHRDDVMDEQILLLRHLRTRPAEPYRREFHASRTAV